MLGLREIYLALVSPSSPIAEPERERDREREGDLDRYREPTEDELDLDLDLPRRKSGDEPRDDPPGLCRRRFVSRSSSSDPASDRLSSIVASSSYLISPRPCQINAISQSRYSQVATSLVLDLRSLPILISGLIGGG